MLISRVSRKLKKKSKSRDLRDVTNHRDQEPTRSNVQTKQALTTPTKSIPPERPSPIVTPETKKKIITPEATKTPLIKTPIKQSPIKQQSPPKTPTISLEQAREELERVLKDAYKGIEHAQKEESVAASELERISKEEVQARSIYETADPTTMERFVRSSLKQYWRLAQKRKKAAHRTLQASKRAVDEAKDVFEWTLVGALEQVQRAKLQRQQKDENENQDDNDDASTLSTEEESRTPSPSYLANYGGGGEEEERPSRMFGMFDAKEYLQKMEIEASEVESGDEMTPYERY